MIEAYVLPRDAAGEEAGLRAELACRPMHAWYEPCRQAFDFVVAAILLAVAAPVIGLAVLLIKLTSRGPAFYLQTRMGRFGQLFTIYKLRTMVHNCERFSGPCWAKAHDPRVTAVGSILRRLHIDELPQLWNVLKGEMSLIGPRPERPEFLEELENALPHYRLRLLVRPGITGLAQVQLPPDIDVDSVRNKLPYDLFYVRYANPWLDLRIYLATALHLFSAPVPLRRALFLLPYGDQLNIQSEPTGVDGPEFEMVYIMAGNNQQ